MQFWEGKESLKLPSRGDDLAKQSSVDAGERKGEEKEYSKQCLQSVCKDRESVPRGECGLQNENLCQLFQSLGFIPMAVRILNKGF